MLVTLSLALWLIGLFLVLKYRVHIHVTYREADARGFDRKGHSRAKGRDHASIRAIDGPNQSRRPEVAARAGHASSSSGGLDNASELYEALVGLGCSKPKARQIAKRVCSQPGSFDELLRAAIREAA